MPSPFPGMDPYIEGWIWPSFHAGLIVQLHDQLNPRLPKKYIATIENFVRRIDLTSDDRALMEPDLYVADRLPNPSAAGVATLTAPHMSVLPGTVYKQRYLKIVDHRARRIVTIIELLSPSNKSTGDDGVAYRHKREEYIGSSINLVEIDLLRRGQRPPLGEPAPPPSDYLISVQRGEHRGRFGNWPFSVREALPPVPVPLDPNVEDLILDLKSCVDHVYDAGRFEDQLEYDRPPEHPLKEPDAAWAKELLAAKLTANGTGA